MAKEKKLNIGSIKFKITMALKKKNFKNSPENVAIQNLAK